MDIGQIHVGSSGIDLGDSLVVFTKRCVVEVEQRYKERLEKANVHFKKEGDYFSCTVTFKIPGIPRHAGEALDKDAYRAVRFATDKVASQLKRRKREMHQERRHPDAQTG